MIPLYRHQIEGADFLSEGSRALWHEMGLGKTRAALMALGSQKAVVICPAIAKNVWRAEALACGVFGETIEVLSGTRPGIVPASAHLTILNYDIVDSWMTHLIPLMAQGRVLILDESHRVRTPNIKRVRAVQALALMATKVWELTGTPMVNSALDFYYQLGFMAQESPFHGMSAQEFGAKYCQTRFNPFGAGRHGNGKWEFFGIKNEVELLARMTPVAQRKLKTECLDLPTKLRLPLYVHRLSDSELTSTAINPSAHVAERRHALAPLKAKLTIEYLEEALSDRPVVVYGYHRNYLHRIANHFKAPMIDGDTSGSRRAEIIEGFQRGDHPVLVAQLQAAGVAVTLTEGHHAVFGELHWSAVDHRQAEDRLHRMGQTQDVTYHYLLVENSIDELVWRYVLQKGSAIDRADDAALNVRKLLVDWEQEQNQEATG
jgi:SWI/SNF-related matrix-associated actin-dependent regulator 1 of chromatin subfamily A